MKQLIASIFLIFSIVLPAIGQQLSCPSDRPDCFGDLKLGPLATGGASANAGDVEPGTKTSPRFSYAVGALLDIPFSSMTALDLAVAFDARAINFHDNANSNIGVDYTYNYIALRPTVRFGGLFLGLGVGVPVSATTAAHGASAPTLRASDMNVQYEGRIGGEVRLFNTNTGSLYFTLEGSYALNRVLIPSYFGGGSDTKNNGPFASSQIGLMYLFDIMRHEEIPPAFVTE